MALEMHILPDEDDMRLDRYLKKKYPQAKMWDIFWLLRHKKIKINDVRTTVESARIFEGDSIKIYHDHEILQQWATPIHIHRPWVIRIAPDILYEDEYFLLVNKPPHLSVHPGDHKTTEASLIELLQDMYRGSGLELKLIHRIDRETSGIILVGKNRRATMALLEVLQSGKITKQYQAIVSGSQVQAQTIDVPLLRQESEKAHTKVIVSHDWQRAITHIQPLETGKDWTRILCTIETGRMHQIRVHCAHVCHPIFWDKRYGSEVKHRATRQLLHAYSLEFRHPFTGKNILCIAPFFPDFKPYVQDSRALFCGGFKDEIARDL